MKKLYLDTPREICKQHDAAGAIILVFDYDDTFYAASYGQNKFACSYFKEMLDRIVDRLISGEITPKIGLEGPGA